MQSRSTRLKNHPTTRRFHEHRFPILALHFVPSRPYKDMWSKFCWRKVGGAHPLTCVTHLPHRARCRQQSEENTLGRAEGRFRGDPSMGAQQTTPQLPPPPFLGLCWLSSLESLLPLSVWRPRDRTSHASLTFRECTKRPVDGIQQNYTTRCSFLRLNN